MSISYPILSCLGFFYALTWVYRYIPAKKSKYRQKEGGTYAGITLQPRKNSIHCTNNNHSSRCWITFSALWISFIQLSWRRYSNFSNLHRHNNFYCRYYSLNNKFAIPCIASTNSWRNLFL